MRTIFTSEDVKQFIEYLFNGNLKASNLSNGTIEYKNENSEEILLVDEETGVTEEFDLAKYLNIEFYSWRNRLIQLNDEPIDSQPSLSTFETWVKSLNFSLDKAYALVEVLDEDATASQDIDNATKIGRITFLINENKVQNLDYYVAKIRNKLLGVPQEIQNSFGDMLNSYVVLGTLLYDREPSITQIGETLVVASNFRINYLKEALSYSDTKVEISLTGDDLYNVDGEIVNAQGEPTTTKYLTMPITKITWQNIFASNPLPTWDRPDLTGFVATALSTAKTLSFYDFNQELTLAFNDLFWSKSAYRINGQITEQQDVNIPVYIRVTSNGKTYTYKDMIDNMQKVLTNSDFNISSITLKGWARPATEPAYLSQLSFDSNGGDPITETIVVFENRPIGELPTPTRTGYDFIGWSIDGVIINEETPWSFADNATAVALWQAKTFTLTLDIGDGQPYQQKVVTYASAIGELPTPPSESLVFFAGWKIGDVTIQPSTIWYYTEDQTAIAEYETVTLVTLEIATEYYYTATRGIYVDISTNATKGTIYYTDDGNEPLVGSPYTTQYVNRLAYTDINVTTKTIKAILVIDGIVAATATKDIEYGGTYT